MEISAQLRKQMDRIQAIKLADLDDGDIPEEKPLDLGMVCSLSIPIITICALMLLMIIVSLLNIVFFWMPLFKICLPKAPMMATVDRTPRCSGRGSPFRRASAPTDGSSGRSASAASATPSGSC